MLLSTETTDPVAVAPKGTEEKKSISLTINPRDLGLRVLVDCTNADDVLADIVAIHGFGARPAEAWTRATQNSDGSDLTVNWLKDKEMLPKVLPKCRIMAFGYDSVLIGENPARQSIESLASNLLRELVAKREKCQRRPIVFVGHCLGGLIATKAYTLARAFDSERDYPHIYNSSTGFVTLGTPFEGFSVEKGLSSIYEDIAKTGLRSETNLVEGVSRGNDVLVNVVDEFTREIATRGSPPLVFCFYEQRLGNFGKDFGVNTELEFVVGRTSGTLVGHPRAGLALGHYEMCKFDDCEDAHYLSISREIKNMVDKCKGILEGRARDGANKLRNRPLSVSQRYSPLPSTLPFKEEPNFVSRGNILQRIGESLGRTKMVVLCGGAGVGKTHIAIKYSHTFCKEFPGSKVLWVNAGSPEQVDLSFKLIADILEIPIPSDSRGKDLLKLVHGHLKRGNGRHWLVVLDGVDEEASHNGRSILELAPKCHNGRVLVTSRSRIVANRLAEQVDDCVVPVRELDGKESAQLLLGGSKSVEDCDAAKLQLAESVAKLLGHSPVALSLAYAYRTTVKDVSLSQYLELIKSPSTGSGSGGTSGRPLAAMTKQEIGVRRAWQLLFDHLNKSEQDTASLMLLVGSLNMQTLRIRFLAEGAGGRNVDASIKILVRHGLVEPYVDRTAICITALIRQSTRDWLDENNQKLVYEERALFFMSRAFPAHDAKDYDNCEDLYPCALAILQFLPPKAVEAKRYRANLVYKVAKFLLVIGKHEAAAQKLDECLRLRNEVPVTTQDIIHAEEIQATMRQVETARAPLENVKAGTTSTISTNHDVGPNNSSRDMVVVPSSVMSLFKAPTSPNKGQVVVHQSLSSNTQWVETFNLALEQAKQGHHQQAVSHYQAALQGVSAKEGEEGIKNANPATLRILGSLGLTKCALGEFDEGGSMLQFVLERQKAILGPNDPETMVTRHNLAIVLQKTGQVKAACAELQDVLDHRIRLLGSDSPATMLTRQHLARMGGPPSVGGEPVQARVGYM